MTFVTKLALLSLALLVLTTFVESANVTLPFAYGSMVAKNGTGYVVQSSVISINSTTGGGNITVLYNSTIPNFVPSAIAVDETSGTIYRLGNNLTNLCVNDAPNYIEIYQNGTIVYLPLTGDAPAAHANTYQDAFYNSRVGLIYATVYNTAPNCSFGNLTSAVVTIEPTSGVSKVLVSFEEGFLVTASGKSAFNFDTLFAYVIVENYATADGEPMLFGIDLQGLKAAPIDVPDISKVYQLSFNSLTNALVYLGNATDDSSPVLGRLYVSEDGASGTLNVTVPLKWLPTTCQGLTFRRGAFDAKSGFYAVACGGVKPEDYPAQLITFNIKGGAHYASVIHYPVILGYFASLAGPLTYIPSEF